MTFRSERMDHYQLIIPREISWEATNQLGKLEMIHLQDISNPLLKPFSLQVKRCEQSLNKIRVIKTYMISKKAFSSHLNEHKDPDYLNKLLNKWEQQSRVTNTSQIKRINVMEEKVEQAWTSYQDITVRLEKLNQGLVGGQSKISVFKAVSAMFGNSYFAPEQDNLSSFESSEPNGLDLRGFSYFISIVNPAEELKITKMVFRVSRGYAWVNFIHSDGFGDIQELRGFSCTVMILFYPNSSEGVIQKKLSRIVDSFSIETYTIPRNQVEFQKEFDLIKKEYSQSKDILSILKK